MKKLLLSLVMFALLTSSAFAQEAESKGLKGAWWGLASVSYSKVENKDFSESNPDGTFTILPAVGTFVGPTVTVGLAAGYTNAVLPEASGDLTDTFIVKPLVRKYWGMSDKFFIFGEANVPLLFNENGTGYGFNIEPGVDFFIGGKWTVEAKFGRFGYNVITPDADGAEDQKTTSFGFNMFDAQTQEGLGSGLSLGLKYIF